MKKVKRLLLFSCGLDSTYLAWKFLKDGTPIHLHHVSMRTTTPLWKQQDLRVDPILSYFVTQGFKIDYSDSIWGFDFPHPGFDSDLLLLAAQKVCQNFTDKWIKVYLGWTPADMKRAPIAERASRNVTPNIWSALVQSARNRKNIDEKLHFPLIDLNITKKDMIEEMPTELFDLTYSCRQGTQCGNCHPCKEIKSSI